MHNRLLLALPPSPFLSVSAQLGEIHQRWNLLKRNYDLYMGKSQFAAISGTFLAWEFELKDSQVRGRGRGRRGRDSGEVRDRDEVSHFAHISLSDMALPCLPYCLFPPIAHVSFPRTETNAHTVHTRAHAHPTGRHARAGRPQLPGLRQGDIHGRVSAGVGVGVRSSRHAADRLTVKGRVCAQPHQTIIG